MNYSVPELPFLRNLGRAPGGLGVELLLVAELRLRVLRGELVVDVQVVHAARVHLPRGVRATESTRSRSTAHTETYQQGPGPMRAQLRRQDFRPHVRSRSPWVPGAVRLPG